MSDTTSYYGIIEIRAIENIGENADEIGLLTAKVVHYPDCQQLILWLPEYGRNGYGNYCVMHSHSQNVLERDRVDKKLNGSVQLLFDSLQWPVGDLVIEIEHLKNGKHVLHLRKLAEGILPTESTLVEPTETVNNSMWNIYRDGFGNPIPNEDRNIRERATEALKKVFRKATTDTSQHLEYEDHGRAGNVIYVDGSTRIKFWYEMGGGNCKLFIDIPSSVEWEKTTNTPLSRRREILEFIARTTQQEQARTWRYEIHEREIAFY